MHPIVTKPWVLRDALLAAVTGIAALAVYLCTLAPTVTPEDSGELIAAAYTLGVPHPPGYPLWCLLAQLFRLVPGPNPAFAINLMSAVLGAIAASLVCMTTRRLGAPRSAAV